MIDLKQLEELAKKAYIDGWPFYGIAYQKAARPENILELIETQRMLVDALQSLLKLASENLPLEECEEYEQAHAAIQKATGESS